MALHISDAPAPDRETQGAEHAGQCRAARALINWTQPKLAEKAGFGLSTIVDYERERRVVSERAIESMTEALQAAGVEFIAENGGGAGVRLKTKKA